MVDFGPASSVSEQVAPWFSELTTLARALVYRWWMTIRMRHWTAGIAAVGHLATVVPAVTISAQAAPREPARLSVMTQNLYLGSSLDPR